jgi:non-ribosomal peptide synthetase component F
VQRSEVVPLVIPRDISKELRAISRREGATSFMILLTAFQTLLVRWTGQEDVVIGTDVQNRNSKETELLIGLFVNQLVLRTDLSGNPSFLEALTRVRQTTLDAYAHQHLPFERLVEEIRPERDSNWSPFFSVAISWQPMAAINVSSGTASGTARPLAAKLDLALLLQDAPEISGMIRYNKWLFERATIERLVQRFLHILCQVVANPAKTLAELDNGFAEVENAFAFHQALDEPDMQATAEL